MKVDIAAAVGEFAEDKDAAAQMRDDRIEPAVAKQREITVDFSGVTLVTQSFIHALVSSVLRKHGESALAYVVFKGCTPSVRGVVETVVQYSLETLDEDTW